MKGIFISIFGRVSRLRSQESDCKSDLQLSRRLMQKRLKNRYIIILRYVECIHFFWFFESGMCRMYGVEARAAVHSLLQPNLSAPVIK